MADFQVGDVQDMPFDEGSFDLVVCFEVLEHLEDPEPALTALKDVLREGGLLIVSSPNRGVYPPGNPYHLHEFTLEELRDALTARFANVVLMRQHPWLASLIDDGTLASPGEEPVKASVARAGQAVDAWTYVVAIASDGAIDEPGAVGVLAEVGELQALQEAVGAAEATRQKLRAAHESKQRKLTEALSTANEDRARLRAALEGTAMELHDLEHSRSWRITRPLRAAGAAFRRLSQWRSAPPNR
jgi:hypothetical protein